MLAQFGWWRAFGPWLGTALALGICACGDVDADESAGDSGGTNGTLGGSSGTNGGSGGATGGSNATTGGSSAATGGTACLGPDGPGTGGNAGGACEEVYSKCGRREGTAFRTCAWLMYDANQAVFEAVRSCILDAPDLCTDEESKVAECTDAVFATACPAPGADVGGYPAACGNVTATCPSISVENCDLYMNVLRSSYRVEAYDCFFDSASDTECATTFHTCVGKPMSGS